MNSWQGGINVRPKVNVNVDIIKMALKWDKFERKYICRRGLERIEREDCERMNDTFSKRRKQDIACSMSEYKDTYFQTYFIYYLFYKSYHAHHLLTCWFPIGTQASSSFRHEDSTNSRRATTPFFIVDTFPSFMIYYSCAQLTLLSRIDEGLEAEVLHVLR